MDTTPTTGFHDANESRSCRMAAALDWAERIAVLALYWRLIARMLPLYGMEGGWADLMLLPSEGLMVCLILIRRGTSDVSRRWDDWALAFSACAVPLCVSPGLDRALISPAVGAMGILVGMILQIHAKFVLGRSMGVVPANRGLKFSGPYRYLRHPMYAGYMLTHFAFLLMNPTLWNAGVYMLAYALQVPRLLAEERLLRKDPRYAEYMSTVRYRLIPGVF